MSDPTTSFRTKKGGHRIYRRSRIVDGQEVFADSYTLRVKQDGKSSFFNLGKVKRDAEAKAGEIMAFLSVEGNTLHEALIRFSEKHKAKAIRETKAPKPVEAVLTVGAMIEHFLEITTHLSAMTRRNNTQALRHFAAGILGLPKLGINQTKAQQAEWRAKVDPFPISEFTAANVEQFRQRELKRAGRDFVKLGSAKTTLNSYLRAARGVFTKKLLPLYTSLNLPEPLPFHGLSPLPEPSHRYTSKIEVPVLIEDAKATLYPTNKDAWIAFLLCIGAGLRREELDKLMWENVDLQKRSVHIRTTEFFRPKAKNSDDSIDLSPPVTAYLAEYKATVGDRRFVLPGKEVSGKIRCRQTLNSLMLWLRERGVESRTPLHTLRKEAGSMIFQREGSIDLAAAFLRNDPRVAREHYIGKKARLENDLPGL